MKDFTITHIGETELSLPMPFKFIEAKGKKFEFQDDDDTDYENWRVNEPITFTQDFWLCAYPSTQELWKAVVVESGIKDLKPSPSHFKGKTRPVEKVSWDDVQVFNQAFNVLLASNKVTFKEIKNQKGIFSLPSEIQWEYAANASRNTVYAGSDHLDDVGWYRVNSNNQTMPVGLKQPNAYGLYDMSGNVFEWCQNDYETIEKNGDAGQNKVEAIKALRGGCYFGNAQGCRLRHRGSYHPGGRDSYDSFRLRFSPSS